MTVRVFLVDDHPLFRAGVRLAMEDAEMVDVVGEASSGEEAVRALQQPERCADVVLMDLWLPGCSGIEAMRMLTTELQSTAVLPRVLIVSVCEDDDAVVAALRAGAHGYLVKGSPRGELLQAVQIVAGGGAVFSPVVAARLGTYFSAVHEVPSRAAFPQLTDRELEILDLLARGFDNRRIARQLVLSEKTVRNHVSHVFAKLQVADRAAAALRARDVGLGG